MPPVKDTHGNNLEKDAELRRNLNPDA
uniref:Uncharacterized protein n=1 Tax=Moniliophthora roreri TaxID=221103 RepID=A0A0W0FTP5_MONRR